jgi:hypothetical protein
MQYTSQNARFSMCKSYRYSLSRSWNEGSGKAVFIGLNPSTADQREDDPTIRRCVGFAEAWGCKSMEIVNLFAFCATKPKDLKRSAEPIGRSNDRWIATAISEATLSIACWGNQGEFLGRSEKIRDCYPKLLCLGINASGAPKHPLYVKATQTPFAYGG